LQTNWTRREVTFHMPYFWMYLKVSVEGVTCSGMGRTKKQSKQDAAYKMLLALGFPVPMTDSSSDVLPKVAPAKSALKKRSSGASGEKKVTFIEPDEVKGWFKLHFSFMLINIFIHIVKINLLL
jgi:hypothetical protein